ncbi:unnamed protein product [Polarella glacialis]|nr:unnamed protein product [Polarella glacialis]
MAVRERTPELIRLLEQMGGASPAAAAKEEPAGKPLTPAFSCGTTGHPSRCGPPCKYARRKGGCRDGANCANCHWCHWNRAGLSTSPSNAPDSSAAGKTQVAQVVKLARLLPLAPVEKTPISLADRLQGSNVCPCVGSLGHPRTCASACKYFMKSKGCKDGNMCVRCHLCRWVRYPGSEDAAEFDELATFSL